MMRDVLIFLLILIVNMNGTMKTKASALTFRYDPIPIIVLTSGPGGGKMALIVEQWQAEGLPGANE